MGVGDGDILWGRLGVGLYEVVLEWEIFVGVE